MKTMMLEIVLFLYLFILWVLQWSTIKEWVSVNIDRQDRLSLLTCWSSGSLSWSRDSVFSNSVCVCVVTSPPHRAWKQSIVITQTHTHQPLLFGTKTEEYLITYNNLLWLDINNMMLERNRHTHLIGSSLWSVCEQAFIFPL